ncbi:M10 family metallopeptidase C-terminal domain-containing protein, partial [Microvirga alba]
EAANEGYDIVHASVDFRLADNLEALILEGQRATTGIGNNLDNTLTGNSANNTLIGGGGNDYLDGRDGADRMVGGAGDDTYIVDNIGDAVIEDAGSGIDRVLTSVSYTLGVNVENLTAAIGTNALSLTGNTLNNTIVGNAGNNQLAGGLGKDTLTGGSGQDTFVFNTKLNAKTNLDNITDFNVKDDTIWLSRSIFKALGKKGTPASPAKLDKKMFWVGPKAHDKDDRIIYDKAKGILYYDADGSGAGKAIAFATVPKKLKMTAADFFII